MPRLIPFALLCLPLAVVGCAPEDDLDDDAIATDPVVVDPVTGDAHDHDGEMHDGDVHDGDMDAFPVESGSNTSLDTPTDTRVAGGDFAGQVVFSVPGMHCPDACAPTVERTLAGLTGVKGVKTDVKARTATLEVEDGFDVEAAKEALAAASFPVDNVTM